MTRVLVIGAGGREHAICRALMTATPTPQLMATPGNAGTADCGDNVGANNGIDGLVALARQLQIDLVVPGPEQPLVDGVADALMAVGIPCCGPSKAAAQLEGSKRFTRELGARVGIPAPRFAIVDDETDLARVIETLHGVPVVKADGLAAGKGVFLPDDKATCVDIGCSLLAGALGDAGKVLVVEERLVGVEASLFYACHGGHAVALPNARDHKRLNDDDRGPNTGGMGAISPNPLIDDTLQQYVTDAIVLPTLRALQNDGTPFVGFLFVGIMITTDGPQLLEFNVRLGDPEAQAILPRLDDGEFLRLCRATANAELDGFSLKTRTDATCAVVVAAHGYPASARKGDAIRIDDALATDSRWLVHAGIRSDGDKLVSCGGRVATVVARGDTIDQARVRAYEGVECLEFDGMHYRTDIGAPKSLGS